MKTACFLKTDFGSSVYRIGTGLLLLSGRKSKSSLILRKGNERNCQSINQLEIALNLLIQTMNVIFECFVSNP